MKKYFAKNLLYPIMILCIVSCMQNGRQQITNPTEIVIFHAGSLSLPMRAAADSFTKTNPNVKFYLESAGSVECARKITELGKVCDIIASADYKVINKLLIPQFASWNILFAGNEMAIVFNDKSKYSEVINSQNWYEILQRSDVSYGRSDPNSDPCGYRTLMTLKLADKHYGKPDIYKKLSDKNKRYIRPKEVDLLALLETNTIDYIFIYKSVAIQHGLKYLELPVEINLSNVALEEIYKDVSVEISGKTPESSIVMNGEPMVYGLTVPKNSHNPELAVKFLQYFLDKNGGQQILSGMGQTPLVPAATSTYDSIPEMLKVFAVKK